METRLGSRHQEIGADLESAREESPRTEIAGRGVLGIS